MVASYLFFIILVFIYFLNINLLIYFFIKRINGTFVVLEFLISSYELNTL
jgi:hypothetical protein